MTRLRSDDSRDSSMAVKAFLILGLTQNQKRRNIGVVEYWSDGEVKG
jgi:hypothetical protein